MNIRECRGVRITARFSRPIDDSISQWPLIVPSNPPDTLPCLMIIRSQSHASQSMIPPHYHYPGEMQYHLRHVWLTTIMLICTLLLLYG